MSALRRYAYTVCGVGDCDVRKKKFKTASLRAPLLRPNIGRVGKKEKTTIVMSKMFVVSGFRGERSYVGSKINATRFLKCDAFFFFISERFSLRCTRGRISNRA